jgi:predicted nucleic acid-binding protein
MAGKRDQVHWDTCVFLSWLKEDNRTPEERAGIAYWAQRAEKGDALIVTSSLTFVEILRSKFSEDVHNRFMRWTKRYVRTYMVDRSVIRRAHDLRDHFAREKALGRRKEMLATPDAIQLATAVVAQCSEFHTFDANDKPGALGLLPLNGKIPNVGVKICKPISASQEVDLFTALASPPMPVEPRKELSDVNKRITAPVTQQQEAGAGSGNAEDQRTVGGSRARDVQEGEAGESA